MKRASVAGLASLLAVALAIALPALGWVAAWAVLALAPSQVHTSADTIAAVGNATLALIALGVAGGVVDLVALALSVVGLVRARGGSTARLSSGLGLGGALVVAPASWLLPWLLFGGWLLTSGVRI